LLADPLLHFLDDLTSAGRGPLRADSRWPLFNKHCSPRDLLRGWQIRYPTTHPQECERRTTENFRINGARVSHRRRSGKGVAASMLMSLFTRDIVAVWPARICLLTHGGRAQIAFLGSTMGGPVCPVGVGRASRDGSVELVSAGQLTCCTRRRGGRSHKALRGSSLACLRTRVSRSFRFRLRFWRNLLIYTDGTDRRAQSGGKDTACKRVKGISHRPKKQGAGTADFDVTSVFRLGIFVLRRRTSHTD